jgi:hypothetical protein
MIAVGVDGKALKISHITISNIRFEKFCCLWQNVSVEGCSILGQEYIENPTFLYYICIYEILPGRWRCT